MRMAKSIANERISYEVIPQSLPKIKFWQNQLSSGAAAIESGTSKNHYSTSILICIVNCVEMFEFFFFLCIYSVQFSLHLYGICVIIKISMLLTQKSEKSSLSSQFSVLSSQFSVKLFFLYSIKRLGLKI